MVAASPGRIGGARSPANSTLTRPLRMSAAGRCENSKSALVTILARHLSALIAAAIAEYLVEHVAQLAGLASQMVIVRCAVVGHSRELGSATVEIHDARPEAFR